MSEETPESNTRYIEGLGYMPNRLVAGQVTIDGYGLGNNEPRLRIVSRAGLVLTVDADGGVDVAQGALHVAPDGTVLV